MRGRPAGGVTSVVDHSNARIFDHLEGTSPQYVASGTWGYGASSRFAAPPLRFGPSGDTPQPQAPWAFHGRKGTSGQIGRVFEINGSLRVKPHIYDDQISALLSDRSHTSVVYCCRRSSLRR